MHLSPSFAACRLFLLLLVLFCLLSLPAYSQGTNSSRKRQLTGWTNVFLNQYKSRRFGKVVSLGNPKLFFDAINRKDLQVVFDPSLSEMGLFCPPEALWGGKLLRNPHLFLKSPEGLQATITGWHELVHAINYYQGWRDTPCLGKPPAKGNREEAYTWLIEARIKWLRDRGLLFDKYYQEAIREKDPARQATLVKRVKSRWKKFKGEWEQANLQVGPAEYEGYRIEPACIKEFDRKLGIDIDINKIEAAYPPILTVSDLLGSWSGKINYKVRHDKQTTESESHTCSIEIKRAGGGYVMYPVSAYMKRITGGEGIRMKLGTAGKKGTLRLTGTNTATNTGIMISMHKPKKILYNERGRLGNHKFATRDGFLKKGGSTTGSGTASSSQSTSSGRSVQASVAGTWSSNYGKVVLKQYGSKIFGYWDQKKGRGKIKDGGYDRKNRRLTFYYYQPWNKAKGRASLRLSSSGKVLKGTWRQVTGKGKQMSGAWKMTRK